MEEALIDEYQTTPEKEKEFTILLQTIALINSANSRAMELNFGFQWLDDGWILRWPDEVIIGMGVRPIKARTIGNSVDQFRILFEPMEGYKTSYWNALFGSNAPSLVISYEASRDKPPIVSGQDDEWLHWLWHINEAERLAALEQAIASAEDLQDSADWLRLAEKSAVDGPRSTLFTGVAAHLAGKAR